MRIFAASAHQIGVASVCSAVLLVSTATAEAACLSGSCSQNGLVFSEASSSFDLTNVTGSGTQADPFIVYQDVRGLDISLAISGLPSAKQHSIFNRPGFALSIVSRNLTGAFWRFYDHELQEIAGLASGDHDGLSFAQAIGPIRPYTASKYDQADEVTDVRDFINFYSGNGVKPGETVRFDYYVTDTIPNQQFFVRQRPDFRTNTIPTSIIQKLQPKLPAPKPTGQIPQPLAPAPSKPSSPTVAGPWEEPQNSPQPVPEPSTITIGILAVVLGQWTKRTPDTYSTKS